MEGYNDCGYLGKRVIGGAAARGTYFSVPTTKLLDSSNFSSTASKISMLSD